MNRCIVHFGMHKTGSTSIQRSLYTHLPDPRFRYISILGANQSIPLITLYGKKESAIAVNAHVVQTLQKRFADALRTCEGRTGILSGEAISALPHHGLQRLHETLQAHFASVEAVGYVRSPVAYMESAFQQRVKSGHAQLDLEKVWPRYRQRFQKFDQVFQRHTVQLWKFDPASFLNRDVVLDYCSRIGIAYPPERTIRVNESLSTNAVKLLYTYFRHRPPRGLDRRLEPAAAALVRKLSTIPGPKFRLSSELTAPLIERHRSDICWMEERMATALTEDSSSSDSVAIRHEGDLLQFDEQSIDWISAESGLPLPAQARHDPETLATFLEQWGVKLAARRSRTDRDKRPTSVAALVRASLHADSAGSYADVPADSLSTAVTAVLQELVAQLAETEHGVIKVEHLGHFRRVTGPAGQNGPLFIFSGNGTIPTGSNS